MQPGLEIAGNQLLAWSLGLTLTTVLVDSDVGLLRDHPSLGRKLAGVLVGILALSSVLLLAWAGLNWTGLLLVAPFSGVSVAYACAWLWRWQGGRRRTLGRDLVITGIGSLLLFMLSVGPQHWDGGIVMGAYAGSAALLGGLSTTLLRALTKGFATEVPESADPFGVPARVVAAGLSLTLLAAVDLAIHMVPGGALPDLVVVWFVLSLLVPLGLVAAGHKLFPRLQAAIWTVALVSTIFGQAAIHTVVLLNPGLIPPAL